MARVSIQMFLSAAAAVSLGPVFIIFHIFPPKICFDKSFQPSHRFIERDRVWIETQETERIETQEDRKMCKQKDINY